VYGRGVLACSGGERETNAKVGDDQKTQTVMSKVWKERGGTLVGGANVMLLDHSWRDKGLA